jgi:hypothetical protein
MQDEVSQDEDPFEDIADEANLFVRIFYGEYGPSRDDNLRDVLRDLEAAIASYRANS